MSREIAGASWEVKPKYEVVDYPKDRVRPGDVILITRFDGVDQVIESFTGSPVGHTAVIL